MQLCCVTDSGSLTHTLAALLEEDPAELASELLRDFCSTELHSLLLGDLGLVYTNQNVVCVAELVLLMSNG